MDGAPWDYGFDLIQEDPERIEHELTLSYERYPILERAGIKRWVNGAFTFTPDGQSAGRPGARRQQLLGRLRRHGRLHAGRRRRARHWLSG